MGSALGTHVGFETFIEMPLAWRLLANPALNYHDLKIMNAHDECLAYNIQKQKITEKMRAVF